MQFTSCYSFWRGPSPTHGLSGGLTTPGEQARQVQGTSILQVSNLRLREVSGRVRKVSVRPAHTMDPGLAQSALPPMPTALLLAHTHTYACTHRCTHTCTHPSPEDKEGRVLVRTVSPSGIEQQCGLTPPPHPPGKGALSPPGHRGPERPASPPSGCWVSRTWAWGSATLRAQQGLQADRGGGCGNVTAWGWGWPWPWSAAQKSPENARNRRPSRAPDSSQPNTHFSLAHEPCKPQDSNIRLQVNGALRSVHGADTECLKGLVWGFFLPNLKLDPLKILGHTPGSQG